MAPSTRRRLLLAAFVAAALVIVPVVGWGAYAAMTWFRFGDAAAHPSDDVLMERYMPRHDIAETHHVRVAAPAHVTFDAACDVDLYQSPVIHAIFRARELVLRAAPPERPAHVPIRDELLSIGWGVLQEVPGRQIVFGAVTRPWEANVVFRALPPGEFASFDSAGYVKIIVTLAADSLGPGESVFRTETRALATDEASRAKFRRYWSVFSPGILLIRTQALALTRRAAERS